MKVFKAYHKGTDVLKFQREEHSYIFWAEHTYDEKGRVLTFKDSDGYSCAFTYDKNGNHLTYKNNNGDYKVKGKVVTKEEFKNFINK